jgi:predicted nucleotidyltransferase
MLDLEPQYLALVKKILATYAKGETVWAYGSRVKGTAHEGSDLDLVIMDTNKNFPKASLFQLQTAFSESPLPILVDLLSWSDIPEKFKHEIEQRHEIL